MRGLRYSLSLYESIGVKRSVSNNTVGFVFQTPSFNTLMSEKVLLSFQNINLQFNFTGTVGAAPLRFATLGGLALRSFPVERLNL